MTTTQPADPAQPLKECDLVMQGGITSGVIYPQAVLALSQEYRFRSIGGTSAGAIAAAATAAAEYGRSSGGFAQLEGMVEQLTRPHFIANLFQPSPEARPLLVGLLAYRARRGPVAPGARESQRDSLLRTLPRVLWTMFRSAPGTTLWNMALAGAGIGLLITIVLLGGGLLAQQWLASALLILFALLTTPIGWLIGLGLGVRQLLAQHLPQEHFYGMCSGVVPEDQQDLAKPALTDWLSDTIDTLAGLPIAPAADQRDQAYTTLEELAGKRVPLTFRHLALNHQPQVTPEHKIVLNMVTTNVSQGMPYTLPFTSGPFLFSAQEFGQLFPRYVVEYMIAVARANPPADIAAQPIRVTLAPGEDSAQDANHRAATETHDLFFLPRGLDLPVIVGARMSLSFPVLISAIPLWTIKAARLGARPADGAPLHLRASDFQRNWFSDGGSCSNFPIHFYDRWLPSRPTFGINMESLPADMFQLDAAGQPVNLRPNIADYRSIIRAERWADQSLQPTSPILGQRRAPADSWRVFDGVPAAATTNGLAQMPAAREDDRPLPAWQAMRGSLPSFMKAVVYTGLFYRDTLLARLPSYYDRIVTVYLSEQEGGMNLDMPAQVSRRIADRGGAAGAQIGKFSFDRHRWVRLRLLLAEMEEQLSQLRGSLFPAPDAPRNDGDLCPPQPTGQARLDLYDPAIQAALAALAQALDRAGLQANTVRELLLCEHEQPTAFPYPAPADWSAANDELTERFVLLQVLLELWTQRRGSALGSEPVFFRDQQAPPRDGMSMRVAPEL